jgi:ferredoxin-NADP reductase
MQGVGAVGTLAASAGVYRWFNPVRNMELDTATIDDLASVELTQEQRIEQGFLVDEPMTSESNIISYNNFYEFSTDKNAVADAAKNFDTTGWQIQVDGVVHYYMLVKSDVRQPLAFAAVLTPILGFRSVKHYLDLRREASKSKSREPRKPSTVRKFWNGELTVANIHRETHDVKTFRFVHPEGDIPFTHLPGQYMNLTLSIDGQTVKRSYTIASSPTQRGHVELTIKRNPEGLASRYMHDQVMIGDTIRIGAPAGKFFFHDLQSQGVVLIAGGVGITPLMSILRNLTDHSWKGNIYFINAMRTYEDRIYADEFANLANRFENLRILNYYSQSKPSPSSSDRSKRWQDKSGYINATDLSAFVPNLNELPVFLCGPDVMMQAVRNAIVSLGIPNEQISTEEFFSPRTPSVGAQPSSSRQPTDPDEWEGKTSTISFGTSRQTIDIEASTTILEAAELAGVALPWECRSGICGQCKVRCTTGRVKMDSRDALSQREESNGYILACQSHPATEAVTVEA